MPGVSSQSSRGSTGIGLASKPIYWLLVRFSSSEAVGQRLPSDGPLEHASVLPTSKEERERTSETEATVIYDQRHGRNVSLLSHSFH